MLKEEKKTQLIRDYEDWWEHKLQRPIIAVSLMPEEKLPYSRGEQLRMCYDPQVPEKDVAKAYRENFEKTVFMGDAVPVFYQRATGILGAYLGQKWDVSVDNATVWFREKEESLKDLHITFDRDHWFYQRSLNLMKAFSDEMGNDLAMGIPDLGGMMDIFESMRGANNSLIELYDDPDEVLRVRNEIYDAYEMIVKEQMGLLNDLPKLGYSAWLTVLSQKPYFVSQCDFCCMISPAHFDRFVKDTLAKESQLVDRSFYHLDGPGAIRHLDAILECGFDGIQWVQGAGAAPLDSGQWDIVYRKVHEHGKLLLVFLAGTEELSAIDHIVNVIGEAKDVAFLCVGSVRDRGVYESYLKKYNVPL